MIGTPEKGGFFRVQVAAYSSGIGPSLLLRAERDAQYCPVSRKPKLKTPEKPYKRHHNPFP